MNELKESDQEDNHADFEDDAFGEDSDKEYEFEDETSLVDSDEEREVVKKRKAREAKINNSFTGPYPIDPTDFNHTDKGPNM